VFTRQTDRIRIKRRNFTYFVDWSLPLKIVD
jgi:hypothetical protein